jgi:tetratricopeptide (TPR) repeat protein
MIGIGILISVSGCASIPRIVFLHDPLTPQEHFQLAVSYEIQNDWNAAIREYQASLDLNPKFEPALAGLGNVYAQQKQYASAEKVYLRLLELDSDHAMANNNLAWIYIAQGIHLSEASDRIERALSVDAAHRAFYLDTRALLLLNLGKLPEARAVSLEAESAEGSDDPAFTEQHKITRSKIDNASVSLRSHRSENP